MWKEERKRRILGGYGELDGEMVKWMDGWMDEGDGVLDGMKV